MIIYFKVIWKYDEFDDYEEMDFSSEKEARKFVASKVDNCFEVGLFVLEVGKRWEPVL